MIDRMVGTCLVLVSLLLVGWVFGRMAFCEEATSARYTSAEAIQRLTTIGLQPLTIDRRAELLGAIVDSVSAQLDFDPLLIVALAFRESRWHPSIERGEKVGRHGEHGLMQVNPRNHKAIAMRPGGCSETLQPEPGFGDSFGVSAAECQIVTGARWLAYVREVCPSDSPWPWVYAYKHGQCPSESRALAEPSTRWVLKLCRQIGCEWR